MKQGKFSYYTISMLGVCEYRDEIPVEFISLDDWLDEKDGYNHIKQFTFFKQFRM